MNYLDKTGLTRLWSKITGKLGQKQDTLVSGTNIKTINGTSLLGSGNIDTNEYKFYTEGGFWYSFKGVTSLDGITATVEGTEINILQLLPEFIHSPKAMEPLIDEMIVYLKMFKISPSVYIDSTTSKYLWVDIKGDGYPQSGTIRLRIRQVNNEYVFTQLEVWSSEYIYYYHVDNFDISPVELHTGYNLDDKQNELVSGENIKTINNQSLLGSGNIDVASDNNYIFDSDTHTWYSYMGLNSLEGVYYTEDETQHSIINLTYYLLTGRPSTIENNYILYSQEIANVTIPKNNYIDSEKSVALIIDMYSPYDNAYLGSVSYAIVGDENSDGYIIDEAFVYSSKNKFEYYIYPDRDNIEDSEYRKLFNISDKQSTSARVTSLSSSSTDTQYPSAKCVYDELQAKQTTLVSGTNVKTINNQSILGSGNINISGTINSDVEQKHSYNLSGQTYYYQFYGVSSIDNITVNVGVEVDVVYATLALIMQSVEELQQSYAPTLSAIQGIHIPNDAYESNVLIIVIHNLGSMTCYINPSTKYVTHATFTNFANGYSVDLGTDPNALTIYYSAVNPANYLSKTNTTSYTPSENYNPATKKYVDDSKAVVVEANLLLNPNDYSITFDQWVTSNPYDTIDTANQANIPVFAKMNVTYNGQTFLSNYMTQTMNNIGDGIKTFSGFFSDETISHVTMMLSESNENNPDLLFREVVYYEGEPHANIADETNTVTVQKFNEVLAVLRSIGAISSD